MFEFPVPCPETRPCSQHREDFLLICQVKKTKRTEKKTPSLLQLGLPRCKVLRNCPKVLALLPAMSPLRARAPAPAVLLWVEGRRHVQRGRSFHSLLTSQDGNLPLYSHTHSFQWEAQQRAAGTGSTSPKPATPKTWFYFIIIEFQDLMKQK